MTKIFPSLAATLALIGFSAAAAANPPAAPVEHPAPKPDAPKPDDGHHGTGDHPTEGGQHPTGH